MTTADEKLKKLEESKAKIIARIEKVKARQGAETRKTDTRRKILVGAVILELVESGKWPKEKLLSLMDEKLSRPIDRALFGLSEPEQKAAGSAGVVALS
jgi:large subunit ribosomal protein L7/L12